MALDAESAPVTIDEETAHLMQLYGGDGPKIMTAIQAQMNILSTRAQTLLSLAAVTVTVTGFSGASIARTGRTAATSQRPSPLDETVKSTLLIRDEKTRAFNRALGLLIGGLTLYVSSIALLLIENMPR